MVGQDDGRSKAFKTAWFDRAARKAGIQDRELAIAIRQAVQGQIEDLGGGVYKKRVQRNQFRSIILAKGRVNWVFVYLFAKQDRSNISAAELSAFRKLADLYGAKSDTDIQAELDAGELMEVFDDDETQVQQ